MDSRRAAAVSFPPPPSRLLMRAAALSLVLVAFLAVPSLAQPTVAATRLPAVSPARLSPQGLFNAQTLRFSQSIEMSYAGGAMGSLGMGTYTGSLQWQPSARLAGRVDVAVAQSLFGSGAVAGAPGLSGGQPQVYLRNAEIAYRPTANAVLHLSVQQSPYGAYASPYGYGSPYGPGAARYAARMGTAGADRLFFRDARPGDGQ